LNPETFFVITEQVGRNKSGTGQTGMEANAL
jgi:hypothetical protein